MPSPTIASASITPSGQLLWVVPKTADGSSALFGISAVADGATITIDGVTTALENPIWSHGLEGFLYPLCPPRYGVMADDRDAGWSSAGTWTEVVPSNAVGGFFDGGDAANAQFHTSSDPAGTCTWAPFAGLVPGRYRLSAHLWGIVGPDRTADALYTVKDGAGATLGAFHFDQSISRYPHFDRVDLGYALHDLGVVTLPAGQDTIRVTLSNAAGTGLLAADAIVLRRLQDPAATSGQVVTATFPAGTATVGGAATDAATDLPVSFLTDAEFFAAIPDAADVPRTIKAGYNLEGTREDWFPLTLADRGYGSDRWTGGVTVDANNEMVGNSGGVQRTLLYYGNGDGTTPWGNEFLRLPGTIRIEFTVAGTGTWDDAARSTIYLANWEGQYVFSNYRWTDLGSSRWRLEVDVARGPWEAIATRAAQFKPAWTSGIIFRAPSTPDVLYQDWKWFDTRTPAGYSGTAHPDEVARLRPGGTGWVEAMRAMDVLGTNASKAAVVGDFPTPAERNKVDDVSETYYEVLTVPVLSVGPVDFDAASDPDHFNRYFTTSRLNGWVILAVADTTPFLDRRGTQVRWNGTPSTVPSTVSGVLNLWNNQQLYVIDGTRLLMQCQSGDTYSVESRATTDQVYPLSGVTISINKMAQMPLEWFLRYCSDVDASPWINVPHLATDALADWMAARTLEVTPDGKKVYVEYSNETWNPFFNQWSYFLSQAIYATWQHGQDPVAYPHSYADTGPYGWMAHRASQIHDRFRAAFTAAGRDPNLVVRLVGSHTDDQGPSGAIAKQAVAEGLTFDLVVIDGYQDANPKVADPPYASTGTLDDAWGRLDHDGMIDLNAASAFHGGRGAIISGHRSTMIGNGLADPPPFGHYESGWSYLSQFGSNYDKAVMNADIMASPRMHRMTASWMAYLQSIGVEVDVRYTWAYYSIPSSTAAWSDLYSSYSMAGTGDPAENANRAYYPDLVSQPYGGRMAYARGASFATPTPTPPPPPPAVGPLIDAYEAAARARSDAKARLAAATAALAAGGTS